MLQVSLAIKQLQRGDARAFMGIFKPASAPAVYIGGPRFCSLPGLQVPSSFRLVLLGATSWYNLTFMRPLQIQEDIRVAMLWVNSAGNILALNRGKHM